MDRDSQLSLPNMASRGVKHLFSSSTSLYLGEGGGGEGEGEEREGYYHVIGSSLTCSDKN